MAPTVVLGRAACVKAARTGWLLASAYKTTTAKQAVYALKFH